MNKPRFALFALVCLLAVLCLPGGALAAADTDFVSKLVSSFYDKTSAWEPILKKYALLVFRWLLILEVCFLGIKAALNREQVGDIFKHFVMLLLMAGFFLAVINNYKEWSWNLIDGLKQIGFELSSPQYRQPHSLQALGMVAGQLRGPLACRPGGHGLFRPDFGASSVH